MKEKVCMSNEKVVDLYFHFVRGLRNGMADAVDQRVDMWDTDGVLEFAGEPPLNAKFVGRTAIHTLYRNRLYARNMPVHLEGKSTKQSAAGEALLSVAESEVQHMHAYGDSVVAGWETLVSTDDDRGFAVSGSHVFTFKGDKIASLRVIVSPKPDRVANLNLEGLTVNDIGRLTLAAWAIV